MYNQRVKIRNINQQLSTEAYKCSECENSPSMDKKQFVSHMLRYHVYSESFKMDSDYGSNEEEHQLRMNDLTFEEVLKLDSDVVLEDKDKRKLYAKSLQRLEDDTFLNEEIIEACISQILNNNDISYYIDTFLKMKLIKMDPVLLAQSSFGTKLKKQVTDKEWIIIPLNVQFHSVSPNHWTIIIINVNNATFLYQENHMFYLGASNIR